MYINDQIRAREVMVIGPGGEQLGIKSLNDAKTLASFAGFDLVLINPTATPPVCKIMDYNKFKYENKKKQKEVDKAARAIIDEVTEQTIISIESEINKYIDGINQKIERDVLKQKAILEKSLSDIKIDISIEENNRSRDIESLEQDLKVIREFRNDNLVQED